MATETEMAPNRNIDQVLGQTDMGAWIAKNKTIVIVLVVLLLAGIFGWGGYTQIKNKKEQAFGDLIYKFQEGAYTQLIDKKIKPAAFLTEFKTLHTEVGSYIGFAPVLIKAADHLSDQGAKLEAIEVLKLGLGSLKTPILNNILSVHLAAAFEDQKSYAEAIDVLENLNSSSYKLMEDKIYLDLGRIYLANGNKEKAKVNLQYLIDNGKDAEFMKLARLQLEDIDQVK